jgi:anti-sigma regulatory factor (Ser/Thr protein kinase)
VTSGSDLDGIRRFIGKRAGDAGMSDEAANDLVIAVSEAWANAATFGGTADVRVTWHESDESVEVVVQDGGVFRNRVPLSELEMGGGHGFPLMRALVDDVIIRGGTPSRPGTMVKLVKAK